MKDKKTTSVYVIFLNKEDADKTDIFAEEIGLKVIEKSLEPIARLYEGSGAQIYNLGKFQSKLFECIITNKKDDTISFDEFVQELELSQKNLQGPPNREYEFATYTAHCRAHGVILWETRDYGKAQEAVRQHLEIPYPFHAKHVYISKSY